MNRMERELAQQTQDLLSVFMRADENCDGTMSREEFQRVIEQRQVQQLLRALDLDLYDLAFLFEHVDIDSDGVLSAEEFISGTMQMRGPARAKRLFELHCDMMKAHKETRGRIKEVELVARASQ